MTKVIGNVIVIEPEDDDKCEECGKVDELRPYGKDGKRICYECGTLNPRLSTLMLHKSWGFDGEPTEAEYQSAEERMAQWRKGHGLKPI